MTNLLQFHEEHGAVFGERGGRRVALHYGRPERSHRAVRNGAGVIEMAYGVLTVEGDDRVEYVDNVVSNRVPGTEGAGCYALLLDPQGRIERELYVYNAGERLQIFTPPGHAQSLAETWRERVFIQDVEIDVASDDVTVFGVHGPTATEKVASVLSGPATPAEPLTFVRGAMDDAGVTVIASDAPTGEEGFEVVCASADAPSVADTLVNRGPSAIPFGYRTWETLTLEAGTPLFETELEGTVPNVLGIRFGLDFEKGCYVGQEVVSRIENRGRPSRRLVGLTCEELPERGAALFDGDESAGEVTRAIESPVLGEPIALALVPYELAGDELTVRVDGEEHPAQVTALPFVDGSDRSRRLPTYQP